MDLWDRAEARYLRGLRVTGDRRGPALTMALLYAWGAIVWWMLEDGMPLDGLTTGPFPGSVVPAWGWKRATMWAVSAFLVYMSLRNLAVIRASVQWVDRLGLARHVGPGTGRVGLAGVHRARRRPSPLSRIRDRRVRSLWRPRR